MYQFKIESPYDMHNRTLFDMTINHTTVCGEASYSDGVFTIKPFKEFKDYIDTLLEKGYGLSTGGYFDNVGVFMLSEVSIVKYPRYRMEAV